MRPNNPAGLSQITNCVDRDATKAPQVRASAKAQLRHHGTGDAEPKTQKQGFTRLSTSHATSGPLSLTGGCYLQQYATPTHIFSSLLLAPHAANRYWPLALSHMRHQPRCCAKRAHLVSWSSCPALHQHWAIWHIHIKQVHLHMTQKQPCNFDSPACTPASIMLRARHQLRIRDCTDGMLASSMSAEQAVAH